MAVTNNKKQAANDYIKTLQGVDLGELSFERLVDLSRQGERLLLDGRAANYEGFSEDKAASFERTFEILNLHHSVIEQISLIAKSRLESLNTISNTTSSSDLSDELKLQIFTDLSEANDVQYALEVVSGLHDREATLWSELTINDVIALEQSHEFIEKNKETKKQLREQRASLAKAKQENKEKIVHLEERVAKKRETLVSAVNRLKLFASVANETQPEAKVPADLTAAVEPVLVIPPLDSIDAATVSLVEGVNFSGDISFLPADEELQAGEELPTDEKEVVLEVTAPSSPTPKSAFKSWQEWQKPKKPNLQDIVDRARKKNERKAASDKTTPEVPISPIKKEIDEFIETISDRDFLTKLRQETQAGNTGDIRILQALSTELRDKGIELEDTPQSKINLERLNAFIAELNNRQTYASTPALHDVPPVFNHNDYTHYAVQLDLLLAEKSVADAIAEKNFDHLNKIKTHFGVIGDYINFERARIQDREKRGVSLPEDADYLYAYQNFENEHDSRKAQVYEAIQNKNDASVLKYPDIPLIIEAGVGRPRLKIEIGEDQTSDDLPEQIIPEETKGIDPEELETRKNFINGYLDSIHEDRYCESLREQTLSGDIDAIRLKYNTVINIQKEYLTPKIRALFINEPGLLNTITEVLQAHAENMYRRLDYVTNQQSQELYPVINDNDYNYYHDEFLRLSNIKSISQAIEDKDADHLMLLRRHLESLNEFTEIDLNRIQERAARDAQLLDDDKRKVDNQNGLSTNNYYIGEIQAGIQRLHAETEYTPSTVIIDDEEYDQPGGKFTAYLSEIISDQYCKRLRVSTFYSVGDIQSEYDKSIQIRDEFLSEEVQVLLKDDPVYVQNIKEKLEDHAESMRLRLAYAQNVSDQEYLPVFNENDYAYYEAELKDELASKSIKDAVAEEDTAHLDNVRIHIQSLIDYDHQLLNAIEARQRADEARASDEEEHDFYKRRVAVNKALINTITQEFILKSQADQEAARRVSFAAGDSTLGDTDQDEEGPVIRADPETSETDSEIQSIEAFRGRLRRYMETTDPDTNTSLRLNTRMYEDDFTEIQLLHNEARELRGFIKDCIANGRERDLAKDIKKNFGRKFTPQNIFDELGQDLSEYKSRAKFVGETDALDKVPLILSRNEFNHFYDRLDEFLQNKAIQSANPEDDGGQYLVQLWGHVQSLKAFAQRDMAYMNNKPSLTRKDREWGKSYTNDSMPDLEALEKEIMRALVRYDSEYAAEVDLTLQNLIKDMVPGPYETYAQMKSRQEPRLEENVQESSSSRTPKSAVIVSSGKFKIRSREDYDRLNDELSDDLSDEHLQELVDNRDIKTLKKFKDKLKVVYAYEQHKGEDGFNLDSCREYYDHHSARVDGYLKQALAKPSAAKVFINAKLTAIKEWFELPEEALDDAEEIREVNVDEGALDNLDEVIEEESVAREPEPQPIVDFSGYEIWDDGQAEELKSEFKQALSSGQVLQAIYSGNKELLQDLDNKAYAIYLYDLRRNEGDLARQNLITNNYHKWKKEIDDYISAANINAIKGPRVLKQFVFWATGHSEYLAPKPERVDEQVVEGDGSVDGHEGVESTISGQAGANLGGAPDLNFNGHVVGNEDGIIPKEHQPYVPEDDYQPDVK